MKSMLLSTMLVLALASCSKKKAEPVQPPQLPAAATTNTTVPTNTTTPTNTVTPPPPDTIRPHSYYPVYPGSNWTYLVNNTSTVTESTSNTYVLYTYPSHFNEGGYPPQMVYTSAYVPLYENEPVFGYSRLSVNTIPEWGNKQLYPFLTETPGPTLLYINFYFYQVDMPQPPDEVHERVSYISKGINNNGDSTIIATGTGLDIQSSPYYNYKTYRVYTKNVGLTFYCKIDMNLHDTIEKKQLLNHYIAPH